MAIRCRDSTPREKRPACITETIPERRRCCAARYLESVQASMRGRRHRNENMNRFGLGLLALLAAGSSIAQTNYPEKPIRIVVGFPPGGTVDTVGRLLAQKLTETLGKPVVVENIAGASGNIATERVAKAAPDGYTLTLMGEGQVVVNPGLYKLPYDQVRDFAPISQVMVQVYLLV